MSPGSRVTLRPFTPADLVPAQALTAAFGWPHRPEDWAFMARHGQGQVLDEDGTLLGAGMTWLLGPRHAALGLVGIDPARQGQGLGRRLMRALLDGVGDRTVVLHATEAGAPLYQSFGFVAGTTIRQWQGIAGPARPERPPAGRIRPIGPADADALLALDTAATGLSRAALLVELGQLPGGVVLEEGGAVTGFALVRPFGRGELIGPAVARDAVAARALIGPLLDRLEGQFVRVDVPEDGGLGPWLQGRGLADAGPGLRMVRGTEPAISRDGFHMQAMMSQALG